MAKRAEVIRASAHLSDHGQPQIRYEWGDQSGVWDADAARRHAFELLRLVHLAEHNAQLFCFMSSVLGPEGADVAEAWSNVCSGESHSVILDAGDAPSRDGPMLDRGDTCPWCQRPNNEPTDRLRT